MNMGIKTKAVALFAVEYSAHDIRRSGNWTFVQAFVETGGHDCRNTNPDIYSLYYDIPSSLPRDMITRIA